MSVDVLIKQKLFGGKTMPLKVILGDNLHYGDFVNDKLNEGELGESEFIAYNPQSIGRGFSVIWNPSEKKTITLRLPQPSTTQELKDFYAAIERMVKYWDAKLVVDGNRLRLDSFMTSLQDMIEFNIKIIKQFSQQVLDGEHDTLTLYSTMWPLSIGKEEATLFLNNPDSYAEWLHEKQAMDVYFASPHLYAGDNGVFGRFHLMNNLPAIFPNQPTVPFGTTDPQTGKQLECNQWVILLGIEGADEPLCEMEYSKFLSLIPDSKKTRYDGSHFLLAELSEEEMRNLCV